MCLVPTTLSALLTSYTRDPASRVYVRPGTESLAYSDGDSIEEGILAAINAAQDLRLASRELTAHIKDWPTRYHLSPVRANLLRPLAHRLSGRTLDVGAGCGVLTRYLGELGGEIVAVEGSLRRATAAAARCRDLPNVRVLHGRLQDLDATGSFDAITLVGVLEWARTFGQGTDPLHALLRHASQLLAPDGVLIIGIENQLGLKYFAGFPEDHTGLPLFGVNDLYGPDTAITFGHGELVALLEKAGLAVLDTAVPLPDYKFPASVITPLGLDDARFREILGSMASAATSADPQSPAAPLFSLEQAWHVAARNGMVKHLANSFLLIAAPKSRARPSATWPAEEGVLAYHYGAALRRPEFTKTTVFRRMADGLVVERTSMPAAPLEHGQKRPLRMQAVTEPALAGTVWTDTLVALLNRPGWSIADIASWCQPWVATIGEQVNSLELETQTLLPARLIDATAFNLMRLPDGAFRFFDLEWEAPDPIEFGYVFFRSLLFSLHRARSVAQPANDVTLVCVEIVALVADRLGLRLTSTDLARYAEREVQFQGWVTGVTAPGDAQHLLDLRLTVRPALEMWETRNLEARRSEAALRDRIQTFEADLSRGSATIVAERQAMTSLLSRVSALENELASAKEDAARHLERLAERNRHAAELQLQLDDRRRAAAGLLAKLTDVQQRERTTEDALRAERRPLEHQRQSDRRGWRAGLRVLTGTDRSRLGRVATRVVTRIQRLRLRLRGTAHGELATSGLFDAVYYQTTYPDTAATGLDPLVHYMLAGAAEGRMPNALFDQAFYVTHAPDVATSAELPLCTLPPPWCRGGTPAARAVRPALLQQPTTWRPACGRTGGLPPRRRPRGSAPSTRRPCLLRITLPGCGRHLRCTRSLPAARLAGRASNAPAVRPGVLSVPQP